MSASGVVVAVVDDNPSIYEERHVHDVYEQIASHFSSTRYKPWPIIAHFLSELPSGWVGLDSGTGNGKYLPLPLDRPGSIWTIGLDRSKSLLSAARTAGNTNLPREVVWGDVLGRGWRSQVFDYAISIATIHHLATYKRRQQAVERLLECVSRKHGRVLIYVWAIEQDSLSKRDIPAQDKGSDLRGGQDVFVPWVLTSGKLEKPRLPIDHNTDTQYKVEVPPNSQTFNRYYHMFAEGELKRLVEDAAQALGLLVGIKGSTVPLGSLGIELTQVGWERSNHYVEVRRWEV